jgi:hypothetical protein
MPAQMIRLVLLLALAVPACARTPVTDSETAGSLEAREAQGGSAPSPLVLVAVGALVLVLLAVASADSDPFLDYSEICGTPDCS